MSAWLTVPLKEVLRHRKGFILIDDSTNYKLCRVQLHRRGVVLREHKLGAEIRTKKQQVCRTGDFLVAEMDAKVGGYGFVPPELDGAIVSSHYFLFELDETRLHPGFLAVVSQAEILQRQIVAKGSTNYAAIRPANVLGWEIPLPPLSVQKRIAKNYSDIQAELGAIEKENVRQQSLIAKLKQAILQEAIQGKLTAEWRTAHPDVEPASQLLRRIQAEKTCFIVVKKLRKEKPLPKITPTEIPFEIPKGWEWCRLIELCKKTGSGSTPSGGKTAYSTSGIPFLRSQNVHNDGLELGNVARIPTAIHNKMKGSIVLPHDLLLNITGGSIGRCTIVTDGINEANVNQHVAIIRPVLKSSGEYLHTVILSPYFQGRIEGAQTGAGREGLPKNKMDRILIPLPPLAEQTAIVERVESLMTTCRALEAEIEQSRTYATNLLQSVLKEAFSPVGKTEDKVVAFSSGFSRQLLAAEILHRHNQDEMTQMKLQKLLHIVEYEARIDEIGGDYQRQAAGPYDNRMMYGISKGIEKQKWFRILGGGKSAIYKPLEKVGQHQKYWARWESRHSTIDKVLNLLGKLTPQQCEIVSTLYAAWNDLLIEDKSPTDEKIIAEASHPDRWHEAKAKIDPTKWPKALGWMREKQLIPSGYGRHTRKLESS